MAQPIRDQGLMPSLIDRLADPAVTGFGMIGDFNIARMMDSVRRDLEDLFNTHRSSGSVPEQFVEVRSSIVSFGLPDLPSLSISARFDREEVCRILEEAIALHEPRLRDVHAIVTAPETDDSPHRLRFHIEARLNVDPSPEVEFETILELTSGESSIQSKQV